MSLLREYIYDNNVRKLGSVFNFAMDATKPPESQTPLLEGDAAEGSNCSHCLNGKEITINAMDVTAVKLLLSNNRTVALGITHS